MRYYDYTLAQKLCNREATKGAIRASMGMREDWFWTAQEVWTIDKGYTGPTSTDPKGDDALRRAAERTVKYDDFMSEYRDSQDHEKYFECFGRYIDAKKEATAHLQECTLGGIAGSNWAKPCILFEYEGGGKDGDVFYDCFSQDTEPLDPSHGALVRGFLGCLSGPAQESIDATPNGDDNA